jgi:hypothetical protein
MKIKKYLLFMSFACMLINAGYAQRFKGGLHIGLLATQVDRDERSGYNKPGLFLGVFSNIPFRDGKIKLQMEIDYAQKGSRSPSTDPTRYKIALHQIEIPVVFGWKVWKEFSLEGGLSLNIIAGANEYYDGKKLPRNTGGCKFNFIETGVIAGVSYTFKEHYALFFRFNYSLFPTLGTNVILRDGRRLDGHMFNNALLFGFSYQF